jgi:sterol 3beta-glucosyltransferase
VDTAIQSMYRDLEYARSLVVAKAGKHQASKQGRHPTSSALSEDEDEEESWTFVGTGDDFDPELIIKKSTLLEAEQLAIGRSKSTSLGSKVLGSFTPSSMAVPGSA